MAYIFFDAVRWDNEAHHLKIPKIPAFPPEKPFFFIAAALRGFWESSERWGGPAAT